LVAEAEELDVLDLLNLLLVKVFDLDHPKLSARDLGATYPKVGSSLLF
jgi:hypothetical protein